MKDSSTARDDTPASFDESSVSASLRRIAETVRARKEAEADMKAAQAEYKAAREAYKAACEEADQTAEDETTELPLFPRAKEQPPKPGGAPGKPAVNKDEPGATWLSAVDGMPVSAVVKLGEKGMQTVGELGEYTAKGGRLEDVAGIGPAMAEKVAGALMGFWKGIGGGGKDGGEKGAA